MVFLWGFHVVLCALVANVVAHEGLHLATKGLLQIHPSFSGEGISLYPGLHPDHDLDDLEHLTPKLTNELYYCQEGHRPALHGAKHGSMKANFTSPTIVLDHTSHLRSIQCGTDGNINLCFEPEAFLQARKTWTMPKFNIITYHVGCGDELSGKRSYFLAQNPKFDAQSSCIDVSAIPIEQEDAVDSGEIAWGTFRDPDQKKRVPVKGHVRIAKPHDPFLNRRDTPSQTNDTGDGTSENSSDDTDEEFKGNADDDGGDITSDNTNVDPDDDKDPNPLASDPSGGDMGEPTDLNNNATALFEFFGTNNIDTSNMDKPVSPDEDLDFITPDAEVGTQDQENGSKIRRHSVHKRRLISKQRISQRHRLDDRGIVEFFQGLFNGVKSFFESIGDFFKRAVGLITKVAKVVIEVAIVAAKLIAVPFGVPFDHSYHNDFNFTHVIAAESTNRPPQIFGYTEGFNLASSGGIYSVQCAKCGVHGDFSVDGRLAFSIKDGITEGKVSLANNDPFTIDAIFGITLEVQYDKPIKSFEKQIAAVPLSPLTIPGIITLGPQLSISGALDLVLNGKAELLIGGSLSIAAGTAALSLVKKEDNNLEGLSTTFTPVAQFNGTLTATVELGLPIALEVGLDILNGKFKKTVGLINKPSVYASATVTNKNDSKCNKGVELRAGVKNRIYVQALDLWDYDIRTDILYEKGIACVTSDGFDTSSVNPEVSVFKSVTDTIGTDIANVKPNITDVGATLKETNTNVGFRIIMDQDKSSILVAGEDGYIYLVGTDEKYDTSSPWGTIDLKSNGVNLDVFGRIMSYARDNYNGDMVEVRVWDPAKVPDKTRAAALTNLKTDSQDFQAYGLLLTRSGNNFLYYPTFCKSPNGLRLYGTYLVINKDGYFRGRRGDVNGLAKGLEYFGAKGCRTVWLTSALVES